MVVEKTYIAEKALQQQILYDLSSKATSTEIATLTNLIRMDKYAPFILNPSYQGTGSIQTLLEINGSGYLDGSVLSAGTTTATLTIEIDGSVYAKFTAPNLTDANGFIKKGEIRLASDSSYKYIFSNHVLKSVTSQKKDFSTKFPSSVATDGVYTIPAGIPFKTSLKILASAPATSLIILDISGVVKV